MPDDSELNGDTKVILNRLDRLGVDLTKYAEDQKAINLANQKMLGDHQTEIALHNQSLRTLFKKSDRLEKSITSGNRWNKIIASVIAFIVAMGLAVVAIMQAGYQSLISLVDQLR